MKSLLPFVVAAALSSGCAEFKTTSASNAQFSELPSPPAPPEPPQPFVRPPAPRIVDVNGAFANPGRYAWTNGMTLQDAIRAAGGFSQVVQRRLRLRHWDGTAENFRWSSHQPLPENLLLKPGDSIVTVIVD